jgi:hypothetical protein
VGDHIESKRTGAVMADLWDNRSVMHKANPGYDMNERRYLYD